MPRQQATLTTTLESLRSLPDGAMFRTDDGRASVMLRRSGDTIIATAIADSLRVESEVYDYSTMDSRSVSDTLSNEGHSRDEAVKNKSSTDETTSASETIIEQKSPPPKRFMWFAIGAIMATLMCKTNVVKIIWSLIKKLI